jgi:hypothetical protein
VLESSIGKEFKTLLNDPKYSDITFIVEGKEIKAHKIILSSRCKDFREIFSGEHPNPILISNFKFDDFFHFLEYVYSDSIVLSSQNVSSIVELARSYHFKHLELVCKSMQEEIILPSTSFNSDFVFGVNNKFCSDIMYF